MKKKASEIITGMRLATVLFAWTNRIDAYRKLRGVDDAKSDESGGMDASRLLPMFLWITNK
jgi:hypothetical protein